MRTNLYRVLTASALVLAICGANACGNLSPNSIAASSSASAAAITASDPATRAGETTRTPTAVEAAIAVCAHPAIQSEVSFPFENSGRNSLTPEQRAMYDEVLPKILGLEPFCDKPGMMDDLLQVCYEMQKDYPDISSYFKLVEENNEAGYLTLNSSYQCFWDYDGSQYNSEPDAIRSGMNRYDNICEQIIAEMPQGLSTFMKYYYLAVAVCERTQYDYEQDLLGSYASAGAFLNGKAVCQGYSLTYVSLCKRAGLYCRMVVGGAGPDDLAHAWDMVRLASGTYYIDLTWADWTGKKQGMNFLRYFMLTQDEILIDHTLLEDTVKGIPQATGTPLGLWDFSAEVSTTG